MLIDKDKVQKPSTEIEYKLWLKSVHGFELDDRYEFYYNTVVKQMKTRFEESDFWKKVINELPEINDKYFVKKGVHLLIPTNTPTIYTKSLDSLIIKAFRKNILNNEKYPEAPIGGWITPHNWFETINDIIRTTITVKYLDGVEFIIKELHGISQEFGYEFDSSFEAREEGYYAAHSGILFRTSIPDMNFSPMEKSLNIEIQVTTQIQEIIKTLLHKHYEEKRKINIPKDYKWQWDHKCPEFTSNYLGHIIQYVEGMIVEIRDKEN
jgi:ppGpp synthetase/RelA/SpoT-type nucleotidyltranferase